MLFNYFGASRICGVFLLSLCAGFSIALPVHAELPNGVAAGDVTHTSAVLWTRSSVMGEVTFEISSDPAALGDAAATFTEMVIDTMEPAKVDVGDLLPGTRYYYRATDPDGCTADGQFVTPNTDGQHGLRFGVSGDWRGDLAPYPSIRNAPARQLDLFIGLGDTIYADVPSPDLPLSQARTLEEFRIKHNEAYSARAGVNALGDLRATTAILAMIDDHEITNDFAGAAPPSSDSRFDDSGEFINQTMLFNNSLQAFHEYNPIRDEVYEGTDEPRTEGQRKLYRQRTYGQDAAFFLLDARSFRDEPLDAPFVTSIGEEINAFLESSFDDSRTMLGRTQLADLKADLQAADAAGVTWKFVLVPEPIQNLGPPLASDRFEGYAAERTDILRFIHDNDIDNAVFIAADIHGTVVNNITFQDAFGGPQIETNAFEITTGSVAYAAPFGPTVVSFIDPSTFGPPADIFMLIYALSDRVGRDNIFGFFGDILLGQFDLDPIGLQNSLVSAQLTDGGYVAVNTYGWTEFDIDAATQNLTVTTWGIDWYRPEEIAAAPWFILLRQPQIVSRFVVTPQRDDGIGCPPLTFGIFELPNVCGCGMTPMLAMPFLFLVGRRRRFI